MTSRRIISILAAAVAVGLLATTVLADSAARPPKPLARNVILLIDDGAGYNHHQAGSLYDTGLREGEAYNAFPFRFAVSTYSFGDAGVGTCPAETHGYDSALAWSDFEYVKDDPTDSAAAATAMGTGVKTYDGAIGVDCQGVGATNLVEVFEELGKSTGVVTSVPFSHATPAGFVAHNVNRDDYDGISQEMVEDSAIDLIMGAGHPYYNRAGKQTSKPAYNFIAPPVWDSLVAGTAGGDADGLPGDDPWTLIQTRAEFEALASGATPDRVFGMAQVRRSLQVDREGDDKAPAYTVPFVETVPTLPEMTAGALNVLDNDPDGFFLMIEGGATDIAAANGMYGRMVEEEISFDRAVDEVLAWVDANSNWGESLVIVTSDHETAYLTGPGSGTTPDGPVWTPLDDNGKGVMPGMQFNLDAHTNSLVPVYAKGDAGRLLRRTIDATDPVRGLYLDNTDIHQLVIDAVAATAG